MLKCQKLKFSLNIVVLHLEYEGRAVRNIIKRQNESSQANFAGCASVEKKSGDIHAVKLQLSYY
jgi:hypothetical protein